MKIFFIIGLLILSASQVFALSYKDALPVDSSYENVDENSISAAKLLQDHVESYENKINELFVKYDAQNTQLIQAVNKNLEKMSESLDVIQYKSINPDVVNNIMQSVITDLKLINNKMKVYLEQERLRHLQKLQDIKNNYIKIGEKISVILDSLIDSFSEKLIQKQSLTQKEKEIVRSLIAIREQNNKIKNFRNLDFESQEDMKKYFYDIITIIREEFQSMKY